ncbi:hypothetical protein B5P41_14570 [Bacillus sp. SRB_28]|nr:hypothetical protein B5P41_14570 [Bacillus sp. SRB_28]
MRKVLRRKGLGGAAGCDEKQKRLAHNVRRSQKITPETKQLRDLMSYQVSFFHERRMSDGDDAELVNATCIFNT